MHKRAFLSLFVTTGVLLAGDRTTTAQCYWTDPIAAPGPIALHSAALDPVRNELIFGSGLALISGNSWFVDNRFRSLGIGGWSIIPNIPRDLTQYAMAYDAGRDRVVLNGGRDFISASSGFTWEWDGSTWTRVGSAADPYRSRHGMVYDSVRGQLLTFGAGPTSIWQGDHWLTVANDGPGPRVDFAYAYDPARGRVVVFGGTLPPTGGSLGDTWEWTGSAWIQAAVSGPAARTDAAMAYDPISHRVILFGGNAPSALGDTWAWDGANWIQLPATGPAPRGSHAMIFDPRRGRVLLTGGIANNQTMWDPWEWDGATQAWIQSDLSIPPAAIRPPMAFDEVRGEMLLYGGSSSTETWTYREGVWRRRSTVGPTLSNAVNMGFDPVRGEVVLFGSFVNGPGTWTWNGSEWSLRTVVAPSLGSTSVAAFDPVSGRLIAASATSGTTWAWDGVTWSDVGPRPGSLAGMCYFPPLGRVLAFTTAQQVWEWSGTSWQLRSGASRLISFSPSAYDPNLGAIVFAVQSTPSTFFLSYDGTTWSRHFTSNVANRSLVQLATDWANSRVMLFGGALNGSTNNRVADPRFSLASPVVKFPVGSRCANGQGIQIRVPDLDPTDMTFEWLRESQSLVDGPQSDGSFVSGAQTPSLRITGGVVDAASGFTIRVTSSCGTAVWGVVSFPDVCRADYDCDGALMVGDIFVFLGYYFSGNPIANHDQMGTAPDVNDIFAFLADWFGGC